LFEKDYNVIEGVGVGVKYILSAIPIASSY
jgi:hypothetical protein